MKRPRICYFAPGSGLGHLNRALAVCLELRRLGAAAEIVTNSPFARALAALARVPFIHIANGRWAAAARQFLEERPADLVVLDTFPWGLRGEWLNYRFPSPVIYVARRLLVRAYREAIAGWGAFTTFDGIIACEALTGGHEEAMRAACVSHLAGPIRLAPNRVPAAVPRTLERILARGASCLVVHGGPPEETGRLLKLAPAGQPTALLTPWIDRGWPCPAFDYYPAANILDRAGQVISGAGYNMMADMMAHPGRHTAIAFARRFDDQAGRLASPRPRACGTLEAARLIMSRLK